MSATYETFGQMSLWDIPNAISSQELQDGRTPCALLGGLTTRPYGPAPALASLSAAQAAEAGLLTSGTSGPRSSV